MGASRRAVLVAVLLLGPAWFACGDDPTTATSTPSAQSDASTDALANGEGGAQDRGTSDGGDADPPKPPPGPGLRVVLAATHGRGSSIYPKNSVPRACAINPEGALRCWGQDTGGPPTTIEPGVTFTDVALGDALACALRTDHSLRCWKSGPTDLVTITVPAGIELKKLAMGQDHQCAVTSAGALYCWGANAKGQLGTGDKVAVTAPTRIGTDSDWTAVVAGDEFTCGVRGGEELYCWGNATVPFFVAAGVTPTAQGKKVRSIAAYDHRLCLVASDGGLDCRSFYADRPVNENTKDWASVSTDCAIKQSGTLHCWADAVGPRLKPMQTVQVGTDQDWVSVASGREFACAVKNDGRVMCFGREAGLGKALVSHPTATQVGTASDWESVAAGESRSCAIKKDGSLHCWGLGASFIAQEPTLVAGVSAKTIGIGYGYCFTSADGTASCSDDLKTWKTVDIKVRSAVEPGFRHNCAIGVDDGLYCWGSSVASPVATRRGTDTYLSIATAGNRTAAVRSDGTLWSTADDGGLPLSSLSADTTWTKIFRGAISAARFVGLNAGALVKMPPIAAVDNAGPNWVELSVNSILLGYCGRRSDGTLACSGSNNSGQVGDGTFVDRTTPFAQDGTWISVGQGSDHACGVRSDGKLFCWGTNYNGALGIGQAWTETPVVIP